jgi:hypothetical protein
MQLELKSNEEATVLAHALSRHLSNLRFEIGGTENAEMRKAMHKDEAVIERLLGELKAAGINVEPPEPRGLAYEGDRPRAW